jgi:hypothetical protein
VTTSTAFEQSVVQRGPRLAAAEASGPAAQLDRWAEKSITITKETLP